MTSYKDAILLLNDLEELAGNVKFPEAERLISQARNALSKDLGGMFVSTRISQKIRTRLSTSIACSSERVQQKT